MADNKSGHQLPTNRPPTPPHPILSNSSQLPQQRSYWGTVKSVGSAKLRQAAYLGVGLFVYDQFTGDDKEAPSPLLPPQHDKTAYHEYRQAEAESKVRDGDFSLPGVSRPSDREIEKNATSHGREAVRNEIAALLSEATDSEETGEAWARGIVTAQQSARYIDQTHMPIKTAGQRYLYDLGKATGRESLQELDPTYTPHKIIGIEQGVLDKLYVVGFSPQEIREDLDEVSPQLQILSEGNIFSRDDRAYYKAALTERFDNSYHRRDLHQKRAALEEWRINNAVPLSDRRMPDEVWMDQARLVAETAAKAPLANLNADREAQRLAVEKLEAWEREALNNPALTEFNRDESIVRTISSTMYRAGYEREEIVPAILGTYPPFADWGDKQREDWNNEISSNLAKPEAEQSRRMMQAYKQAHGIPSHYRRSDLIDRMARDELRLPDTSRPLENCDVPTEPSLDDGLYDDGGF